MKQLKEINVGEQFKYKGFHYTKLNEDNLCILDDKKDNWYQECLFDNVNNDYATSLIRHYIKSAKYLNFLGLKKSDFLSDKFGFKKDKLFLLSEEEYERYRFLINPYGDGFWLCSAYTSLTSTACYVDYYGDLDYGYVSYVYVSSTGYTVRPALYLKSSILVEGV